MLLNAVGFLSRSSIKMLLAILMFIMVHFPSVALAAPVCDDTNIGHIEIVLPGSISPGVDLPPLTPVIYNYANLVNNYDTYNCHVTSGDQEVYFLYGFLEPLS